MSLFVGGKGRFYSRKQWRSPAGLSVKRVVITCIMALFLSVSVMTAGTAWAVRGNINAPGPLRDQPLIQPPNLNTFLNGSNAAERATARAAAIALGKALLWDVQVGSDGKTACASCHFHAGTDARAANTLNRGANGAFSVVDRITSSAIGPNGVLTGVEFPFHQRQNPESKGSIVIQDYDDVVGSQGVRLTQFVDIVPGQAEELGTPVPDPVFNLDPASNDPTKNVRQVTGRNSPTFINAAYNFTVFSEGRANNVFNGVNPFGPADGNAKVLAVDPLTGNLVPEVVRIRFAALASQAAGPPLSTVEMSYVGRTFPKLGKKMLRLRPLALQAVDANDSAFGPANAIFGPLPLGLAIVDPSGLGLSMSYADLIKAAFKSSYWSNTIQKITFTQETVNGVTSSVPTLAPWDGVTPLSTSEFTQMEANFSLFLGLAVQLYEMTLIADDTRFDRFQSGDLSAYTQEEARGLQFFLDSGCGACHAGTEFTGHSQAAIQGLTPAGQNPAIGKAIGVEIQPSWGESYVDEGIYNIGIRPTGEDLGRGGATPPFDTQAAPAFIDRTFPLSFTLLALLNKAGKLPAGLAEYVPPLPADPNVTRTDMVQGAFKVPSLRTVELTGPYFHNGSVGTLTQALDLYLRGGNFPEANTRNLHPAIAPLFNLQGNQAQQRAIVAFLLTLTDERVRQEAAPFDHPAIDVPAGQDASSGADLMIAVPAVGAGGRAAAPVPLPPLRPYLGLNQFVDPFLPSALVIAVTAPNGGQSWANGGAHTLNWTLNASVSVGAFNAWLVDGAGNWVTTADTVAAVPGQTTYSVPWTVNAPARADYKLAVYYRPDPTVWGGWTANDQSDATFTVTAAPLTVTAPNGGESCANGAIENLVWTLNAAVSVGAFNAWLIDGAGNWITTVDTVAAVPGLTIYSVPWIVAAPAGAGYKLAVWYRPDPSVWGGWLANDESNATFTVTGAPLAITVTAPNAGTEIWADGTSQNLDWTLNAAVSVGAFNAWLIDGAGNWVTTVDTIAAVPAQTSYSVPWTVSAPARADYKLTVWYRPDPAVWGGWVANDESNATFTVTGAPLAITVSAPNGGESWTNGTSQNLDWTLSTAVSAGAFNAWLIDGAGNWVTTTGTVAAVPGQTIYSVPWIVAAAARADYKLTVWYRPDAAVWGGWTASDESNAAFTVTP